jgi:PAS domain S-box-containing protein
MINYPYPSNLKLVLEDANQTDDNLIYSLSDEKGTILYVNDNFSKISGYSKSELVGANHSIINSGLHTKDFFKQLWRTIGNGNIWQGEIRNKKKDNSFYWVNTIIFPTKLDDEEKKRYFSIRTVIDDKKQAEIRNNERIKEMQSLLHTISHQMRQPVTQIMGLTSLLDQFSSLTNELSELLAHLNTSAALLNKYTIDLTAQVEVIANKDNLK